MCCVICCFATITRQSNLFCIYKIHDCDKCKRIIFQFKSSSRITVRWQQTRIAEESCEIPGRLLRTSFGSRRPSTTIRSTSRHHLTVPLCYPLSTFGRRAFPVAGPTSWNSLPDCLRYPTLSSGSFRKPLKTKLFASYLTHSAQ